MTIDSTSQQNDRATEAARRSAMKSFWGMYEEAPTVESMMLNQDAGSFSLDDMADILAVLPPLQGQRVVELGAGIGRFTGEMAKTAKDILTTDFIASFIDENRNRHQHLPNVRYQVTDAMGMVLERESVDFVFTNWLMMYLSHAETVTFLRNCLAWLTPGGQMHIRESCSQPSSKHKKKDAVENPTFYRHISQYLRLLAALRIPKPDGKGAYGFEVLWAKSVPTYIRINCNWRQVHLMVRKVEVPDAAEPADIQAVVGDLTRSIQDAYDTAMPGLRAGLGQRGSPLEGVLLGAAAKLSLGPSPAVCVLSPNHLLAGLNAKTVATELGCGVEVVQSEELGFSAELGLANEARCQDCRFLWTPSLAADAKNWQMPKDFFNLALGSQLLGEKNAASNAAQLVKSGGRLLTLEASREDGRPDFAAALGSSFSEVAAEDVTDAVRAALADALEKTKWEEARKEWQKALDTFPHWHLVSAVRI